MMAPEPILVQEIAGLDPAQAAARLRRLGGLAFLDSAMRHPTLGRYSYVAASPFGRFVVRDGEAFWNEQLLQCPPLTAFSQLLDRFAQYELPALPPFQGGAIGFFSYEFGCLLERLPAPPRSNTSTVVDAAFFFYDVVLAFDHEAGRAWLISTGLPERDVAARSARATSRANFFRKKLYEKAWPAPDDRMHHLGLSAWRSNFSRESYIRAVNETIDAILSGDIFQANISQKYVADLPPDYDPWTFYLNLRQRNPSTFAAFLDQADTVIASSSPERFLKVCGTGVESRPIKGTAPRAADPAEDRRRAEALLTSEKDRAENLMIVDLLRNDLSRVCLPHSVKTPVLCGLESYAGVHHLVSTVTGELQAGMGTIDLIAASFPGGSITGAPKIRAMEIISEIERERRGVYCGSIGFIGFNGKADMNIAIRTVIFQDGKANFQVGGGITALSDPDAEYDETLAKAERLFQAFRSGEEARAE
jgi:para-aminobenzoate synthetase component 1